jgi:hypothetical protein
MAFETGETFSPSIQNSSSKATGLIQFIKPTATALGTTLDKLKAMTDIEQLDYVAAYFKPYKNKMSTVSDVYMAILWPAAIGKPEAKVLFAAPSKTYEQNKGLDFDKDGTVTKAEAAAKVFKKLAEGMKDGIRG